MRTPFMVPLLTAVLAACSNGGLDVSTTRTIPPETIPGDPVAHELAVTGQLAPDQIPPTEVRIDEPGMDSSGVTFIALTSMQFTIDAPADGTAPACWDFVKDMTVSIESTQNGSTLPRVAIATASTPGCTNTLTLTPDPTVNLKPYTDGGFRIVVDANGIPPAADVTFEGTFGLQLSVL